jgi:uncharacterized protein YlxW (UPF0749 family)
VSAPAPAPGKPRSLGASLLDQVLAETLDPAYAQAAAARTARDAGPDGGGAPTGWLRRRRGQLLVALTLLVAGLLASITYGEAAAGAQGRDQARQALRDDIGEQSDTADDLAAQLEELTAQVTRTRQQALEASVVGQRALEQLAEAGQAAAAVAVSGPGLRVTMDNAPPAADTDPVGGSGEVAGAGIVQDGDLQLVVNALWASGAEAISINGQRIGATTAIRQAGKAILVDLHPVNTPYEISAIGDPQDLSNAFLSTPEASVVAGLSRDYGLVFEFARDDDLALPAGTSAELRWATPLDPATDPGADPTTAPGTGPGSDLVAPDRTTDGG